MNVLEQQKARLDELRTQSAALLTQRGAILDKATAEKRGLTDAESKEHGDLTSQRAAIETQIPTVVERVAELEDAEKREQRAADSRVLTGQTGEQRVEGGAKVEDPKVYLRGRPNGQSYFRDLAKAQLFGDRDSGERLSRHAKAFAAEQRALGNTNTVGGSGGEFAPPEWLVADYIALARAGRVTADLFKHSDVPTGVSSVNLPKVLTGTAVALQSTQNTALPATDLTTGAVGTGFATVGGQQVTSQQLLDQSEIDFDTVITSDMAAAYAQNIGSQTIYGAGTGNNNNAVINGLVNAAVATANQGTFTAASPTAAGFYSKCAGLISAMVTSRFAQPTVWLMHPRRFYWLIAQTDSNERPLVVPRAVAQNPMGTSDSTPTAGDTGMTFLGLPVVIDPQLPTNLGTATNQDEVFLLKQDDLWLFESPVTAEVFREPYAGSMGVLFRLYAYAGTILNRYSTSIATLNGTGLAAPAF